MTGPDDDPYGRQAAFEATLAARAEQAADNINTRTEQLNQRADPDTQAAFDRAVAENSVLLWTAKTPTPLTPTQQLPDWPTHTLPDWITNHIHATSRRLQVPVDLCAQLAVGVLAAATMGTLTVTLGDWTEPTNLYLFAAMHSGAGKSPAEKAMVGPLREWEKQTRDRQADDHNLEVANYKVAQKRFKEAEALYTKNAIGRSEFEDAVLSAADPPPAAYRLTVDDATPERLTQLLAAHQNLALISTEAGLLDMVAGAYAHNGRTNLDVYLKAWAGETIQRDRKGGDAGPETTMVEDAHLSVVLTIQPSVIERYQATSPDLRGRGFFARFMPSVPRSLVGKRTYGQHEPAGPEADTYRLNIHQLANQMRGPKHQYQIDPDAAELFYNWCDHMETMLAPGQPLEALHDASSKIRSSVLRTAALLQSANWNLDPINTTTMGHAITIGDYWVAHAMAIEGVVEGINNDDDRHAIQLAGRILDWCRKHRTREFTPRDLMLSMRRTVTHVEQLVPALKLLWNNNWLWFVEGDLMSVGFKGVRVLMQVHPIALTKGDHDITDSVSTRTNTRTRIGIEGKTTTTTTKKGPHTPPPPARVRDVRDPTTSPIDPTDPFA